MDREFTCADFNRKETLKSQKMDLELKRADLQGQLSATSSVLAYNCLTDPNDPSPHICPTCGRRIIEACENSHRASHVFENYLRLRIQQLDAEIRDVNNELDAF